MREVCPNCESAEITLYGGRSGKCGRCGTAFAMPKKVDVLSPKPLFRTAPSYTNVGKDETAKEMPGWRRSFRRFETVPQATLGRPPIPGYTYRLRHTPDPEQFVVRERCHRIGGSMVGVGSLFLILSQVLAMSALYFVTVLHSNNPISVSRFYDALMSNELGQLICGFFIVNIVISLVGFGAGIYVKDGSIVAAATAISIGCAAIVTSVFVVGGIFGVYGGIFMIVGGVLGLVQ